MKRGGGGGGQFASGPIRKVCGGRGQSTSGPIYEKCGGGGPVRFRSDTFVWHTENIYMYLPTYYTSHACANEYMPAKVNLL